MTLDSILDRWKADPGVFPNIGVWKTLPSHKAELSDFPPSVDTELIDRLSSRGISALYKHQQLAYAMINKGQNVVLSTGTASGKSLAYQLPILNEQYRIQGSTALLLFPTKALARDQLDWFMDFPRSKPGAYDGDTPPQQRKNIREKANIIISNPDMLHLGILPYHTNWIKFFSNLKYVVLDEIHVYRGVFGSHVANVLRRLKRVTDHYGSSPQYILTSATIGNPKELAEGLVLEEFQLIDRDTSARGEKHFLFYNPPVIDEKLGLRASMQGEAVRLASDLISGGFQTILFGRSRRSVEFMLARLQDQSNLPDEALQAYRSGYLPSYRRDLEASLRSGIIRGITATTALELGIDIGGLDASILAGFPGTIAGAWQQAGRAGRSDKPSLAILVASSNPLDQYLAKNPDYFFGTNPENGLIDAENLLIALAHIQCAAFELPFQEGSRYGAFSASDTTQLLDFVHQMGKLHLSNNTYYWMSGGYPSAEISLRSTSSDQISLQVRNHDSSLSALGTVDHESALWMVHPGAIYLHGGDIFHVDNLDLDQRTATLSPSSGDYYTEAEKQTEFSLQQLLDQVTIPGADKSYGEIQVTSQVTGYKKINWEYYEILGRETLELPPTELSTEGMWITISEESETILRESGVWSSSPNDYGPDWDRIRLAVLERDNQQCVNCGKSAVNAPLHVHHKMPLRSFPSYQEANQLDNLVSLCPRCHQRAEAIVRVNSGISGLGYILHSLAPILLMCDPGDLGLYTDFRSPFGQQRPIALLYEYIPAGIGFSKHLFENLGKLLEMANQVIGGCSCQDGCPSCVGPGGEKGSGGKLETLAILDCLLNTKST